LTQFAPVDNNPPHLAVDAGEPVSQGSDVYAIDRRSKRGQVKINRKALFRKFWRRPSRRSGLPLPSGAKLPSRAVAIWRERPDLQAAFDVVTASGQANLFWWYVRHGFAEMGLQYDSSDDAGLLAANQPHPRIAQAAFLPITWLMDQLKDHWPRKTDQPFADEERQASFLAWFFSKGLSQANLDALLSREQAQRLMESDPHFPGVPRILTCMWASDPELKSRFPTPDDPAFRAWCLVEGARTHTILGHPLIALAAPQTRTPFTNLPFGVNLFGHVRSRSGISEDVRMAAQALDAVDIPYTIHNVEPGAAMPDEEDQGTDTPTQRLYAFNLFCMPAQTTAAAMTKIGRSVLADHYNIGMWPWELPEMPRAWLYTYDLVDEIWAASHYTHAAYCRSSSRPVRHMPMAVSVAGRSGRNRASFNLPESTFLFGFAFDGLSSFSRKAPLHCIEAFLRAFPRGDMSVGLVIKGLRTEQDVRWQQVLEHIGNDPRIHIITQSLPRAELIDLWHALDCFISLHRSEGFGRNIAEAMLLEKPVIVTAHSGNMDFTNYRTAALVPVGLREVKQGEYPFGAGQHWAEPDIDRAAKLMQKMVQDDEWRHALARGGKCMIERRYSAAQVGAQWQCALREIYDGAAVDDQTMAYGHSHGLGGDSQKGLNGEQS